MKNITTTPQSMSLSPSMSSVLLQRSLAPLTDLFARLSKAQGDFRVALCDSFDTPKALQHLIELVSATNIYLSRGRAETNVGVVAAVAEWVTRMLRMFGLGEGSPTDSKGERVVSWGVPGQETAADVSSHSFSWILLLAYDTFSDVSLVTA